MRKQLLLIALAVAALASCSKDKSLSVNNGSPINFRSAIATRVAETTTANLTSFNVAAYNEDGEVFGSTLFSKNEENSYFVSTPAVNWPDNEKVVSFYAYAPTTLANVTLSAESQSVAYNAATTQADFVTATATGTKAANAAGVELTFAHQLSQIEVQAKNTNESYVFKATQVKIGKSKTQATYTFAGENAGWGTASNKADVETAALAEAITIPTEYTSIMGENGNLMLLPQTLVAWDPDTDANNQTNEGAYLAVKLQIKNAGEEGARIYPKAEVEAEYAWIAIPINTVWEAGKKYIYQLDFTDGAGKIDPDDPTDPGADVLDKQIRFTVTVTDWTDADPIPYPANEEEPEIEVVP